MNRLPLISMASSIALALLLTGCETSTLADVPVAEAPCDARLAGDWLQAAGTDPQTQEASTQVRIDARCRLVVTRRDRDGMHLIGPIDLHVGRDDASELAWVDGGQIAANLAQGAPPPQVPPADADAAGRESAAAPYGPDENAGEDEAPVTGQAPAAHDFIVVRYTLDGDRLRLYPIDADASARRLLTAPLPVTITRHSPDTDTASALQTAIHVESPLSAAQFHDLVVFAAQPAYEFNRNPRPQP